MKQGYLEKWPITGKRQGSINPELLVSKSARVVNEYVMANFISQLSQATTHRYLFIHYSTHFCEDNF